MSEFVVGQWVECVNDHCTNLLKKGQFYRVGQDPHYNGCGVYIEEVKALFGSKIFRPVEWQVGRTYKTTLEGVTATIAEIDSDGDFWGNDSREHKHAPKWCWSGKTGILYELKDDKTAPHLTPYLADEPSKSETDLEQVWNDAKTTSHPERMQDDEECPFDPPSRYHRTINGVTLDLYDLADAYGIKSHRIFHALKKLIMAGRRGHKDREQDLREAIVSIESELRKMKGGA